ncbi:hypothetical protein C8J56DRAFT_890466 [Mycena floridula]|nr:hypothetical protein C8J56DRAFT_890466 [Mycena floridula]
MSSGRYQNCLARDLETDQDVQMINSTKDIFGKPIGYTENKIVNVIIRRAWFKDGPSSIAVIFKRFFDPVSLNTLALIFTAVRFCLEEWSTGQWIKGPKFSQGTEYNSRFKPLLEDLIRWDAVVPSVTLKIRERMYKKCRDTLGIDGPSGGRTGDTDSEDDFLDDDDDDADAEPLNAAGLGIDPASTELMNSTMSMSVKVAPIDLRYWDFGDGNVGPGDCYQRYWALLIGEPRNEATESISAI